MKKLVMALVLLGFLSGCAESSLKAPCNATGSNCLPRIKINQWNNN